MKNFPAVCLIFFSSMFSFAQPGEWVWIHGSNTLNDPGTFGVQGVSDPANNPPAVYEPCEWKDQNGNLWIYGGLKSGYNELGDLWKYDPVINEWTWMKGTGVVSSPVNYGSMGVPSPSNTPGSRSWGMASWTDNQGNFWMFGGMANQDIYADLWRYEPATNNWTWMNGPQGGGSSGVYGTQGVPSPGNSPPCRHEIGATWTDNSNNLWMFSGLENGVGERNDMWRYNITTNEWTWMKGSSSVNAPDVYGVQGVEDPANTPGGREVHSQWKDLNGNFWFFGGSSSNIIYNDLWRYNPVTNNWAWFKGGNTSAVYGTLCIPDSSNTPGVRLENRATVTDANGNFWMFGGFDGPSYNDLWKYCVSTNKWTWVSGDNLPNASGNWGTIGVSSPLNKPSSRFGHVMWINSAGEIFSFGGAHTWLTPHSDMWKFTIDPACGICSTQPQAVFTAPNQICPGTCIDFINNSVNSTSYIWSFQGGSPGVSTDANPTNICYSMPGTYSVSLIASDGVASDTTTLNNYITVYPFPPPQGILQNGDTLFSNAGAVSYQWYHNGVLIPGATDYFYVAPESGNYQVIATDNNGCEVEAVINDVIADISQLAVGNGQLAIFPNPVNDILEVRNLIPGTNLIIVIYNNIGEKVFESNEKNITSELSIDVSSLASGVYFLELSDRKNSARKVFTKK